MYLLTRMTFTPGLCHTDQSLLESFIHYYFWVSPYCETVMSFLLLLVDFTGIIAVIPASLILLPFQSQLFHSDSAAVASGTPSRILAGSYKCSQHLVPWGDRSSTQAPAAQEELCGVKEPADQKRRNTGWVGHSGSWKQGESCIHVSVKILLS